MNARISMLVLFCLVLLAGCQGSTDSTPAEGAGSQVSGELVGGLRVLTIDPAATDQQFTIYRGDYVRLELTSGEPFTVEIPARETVKSYPVAEDEKPYIKFPDAGAFPFTAGDATGVIEALEYRAAAYREVDALEARDMIANLDPLILDVRTPGEFAGGHIEDAWLIPVQEIQKRLQDLEPHRDQPIFVYCRSGNRSTVAAKVLVDAGFPQVINLRKGIVDWAKNDLPVVK
jgi:rhodanese-related sulfurtransferase